MGARYKNRKSMFDQLRKKFKKKGLFKCKNLLLKPETGSMIFR